MGDRHADGELARAASSSATRLIRRERVREQGIVQAVDHVTGRVSVLTDSGGSHGMLCTGPLPGIGQRVWVEFREGGGVRLDGAVAGDPNLLGFTPFSLTATSAGTTPGLLLATVNVACRGDRVVRVHGHLPHVDTASVALTVTLGLFEVSPAGVSAQIATLARMRMSAGGAYSLDGSLPYVPARGAHTFQLRVLTSTGTALASATGTDGPGALTVTDEGPSSLPLSS